MRLSHEKCIRHLIHALIISLTSISFWACANVQHQATFNKNYLPKEEVRIKVAKVINDTGYTFDIDIEQMLANTLEDQLVEENLLSLGKEEPNLFMESRIIGYKKGSAFKRWMMPGWGATELAIRCDLKDDKNNLVGSAMSSREIIAGGLYTVGAWETIFKDVANDVAEDLKDQIEAQGYVVKPKTQPQGTTTAANDIEQSASATVQPQEAPKLASIPKDAPVVQVSLRKKPLRITEIRIPDMLLEYDFFESSRNTKGSFVNDFVDNNDGTVTDKTTGLIWQKSGSSSSLRNRAAKEYIKRLNKERFTGHSDWRMPTVEELASLLARKRESGVYLDPLFDRKQSRCWTVDKFDATDVHLSGAWIVDFKGGQILQATYRKGSGPGPYRKNSENYVKAVRSVK